MHVPPRRRSSDALVAIAFLLLTAGVLAVFAPLSLRAPQAASDSPVSIEFSTQVPVAEWGD